MQMPDKQKMHKKKKWDKTAQFKRIYFKELNSICMPTDPDEQLADPT